MLNSRASTALRLAPALLAIGLIAGCSGGGNPATVDTGVVQPWPMPEHYFDVDLATQATPDDGWLSAPWGLGRAIGPDDKAVPIIYVAGDTVCYGPAGFTLEETDSKVTIGSYTVRTAADDGEGEAEGTEAAQECPSNPVAAWKYGTINLTDPLGKRELVHVGLDELYSEFTWPEVPDTPAEQPTAATPAASPDATEGNE